MPPRFNRLEGADLARKIDRHSTCRRVDVAMNTEIDARRDERGVVDIAFYKRRAERLRRQAIIELTASARELLYGWLRRRRPAARHRLVKP